MPNYSIPAGFGGGRTGGGGSNKSSGSKSSGILPQHVFTAPPSAHVDHTGQHNVIPAWHGAGGGRASTNPAQGAGNGGQHGVGQAVQHAAMERPLGRAQRQGQSKGVGRGVGQAVQHNQGFVRQMQNTPVYEFNSSGRFTDAARGQQDNAPITPGLRSTIDQIKADSAHTPSVFSQLVGNDGGHVPEDVVRNLTDRGYLKHETSASHDLLGVGQSKYSSGPKDTQGAGRDRHTAPETQIGLASGALKGSAGLLRAGAKGVATLGVLGGGKANLGETARGLTHTGEAVGKAFYQDPLGVGSKTVGQIPGAANALLMLPPHLAATAATGHSGAAWKELKNFAQMPAQQVKDAAGAGGMDKAVDRIKKEGALNDLGLLSTVGGGVLHEAGRGASSAVRATNFGGKEFARTRGAREANTLGLQEAHRKVATSDQPVTPDVQPSGLGPIGRAKSFVAEAAQQGNRPPRRYGFDQSAEPVRTPVGVPSVPLVARDRSPNLFVSAGQTGIDRFRMKRQQDRLASVVDRANHDLPPGFASQLDMHTKPGEVVSKVGRGRFDQTGRAQRFQFNVQQGDAIRTTQEVNRESEKQHDALVADLNPGQKDILTFVKEGSVPPHDPGRAQAWISELKRQYTEGRQGKNGGPGVKLPLAHRNALFDNVKLLEKVEGYANKHGWEKVFNPEFAQKAAQITGERETAHLDPTLHPDTITSKRITPQIDRLDRWAQHELAKPDPHPAAAQTAAKVAQIRHLFDTGFDLRRRTESNTPESLLDHWGYAEKHMGANADHVVPGEGINDPAAAAKVAKLYGLSKDKGATPAERAAAAAAAKRVAAKAGATDTHTLSKADVQAHMNEHVNHQAADAKYANAEELHRSLAADHGLPSDPTYYPHVDRLGRAKTSVGFMVNPKAGGGIKRNMGHLDRIGHTVRNPDLLFRAQARNRVNAAAVELARKVDKGGVGPDRMTAFEAENWMAQHHMNPEEHTVMSMGGFERGTASREHYANIDPHFDSDQLAHSTALSEVLADHTHAPGSHARDPYAKGFKVFPKAMADEMKLGMSPAPGGLAGKLGRLKGNTSKYMLGTSPSWATAMWPAYYVQGAIGGALTPRSWIDGHRWYNSLNAEDKRTVEIGLGVDSKVHSSHDKSGTYKPPSAAVADKIGLLHSSPVGKLMKNPVNGVLAFERIARRDSRTAVIYKGMRKAAIKKMVEDGHGLFKAQGKAAEALTRMSKLGNRVPKEYMDQAFKDQKVMEEVARHTVNVMGDFHHFSRLERSGFNQIAMFYPWLRYSAKLAFHVLPARHPLLTSLAAYMGTLSQQDLHDVLGTDPQLGNVYVGAKGSNIQQLGFHSANPLLNSVVEALDAGSPSKAVGMLPPYVGATLDYLYQKASFTGKPLKTAEGGRDTMPNALGYAVNNLTRPFAPVRAADAALTGGKTQSADSLPFLGMEKDAHVGKNSVAKPAESAGTSLGKGLLSYWPRPLQLPPQKKSKSGWSVGGGGSGGWKPAGSSGPGWKVGP